MDDLNIKILDEDDAEPGLPTQRPRFSSRNVRCQTHHQPDQLNVRVICDQQVLLAVQNHAYHAAPDLTNAREIGGVLLGIPHQHQDAIYIDVQAYLPARVRDESGSSLTHFVFTRDAWTQMLRKKDEEYPQLEVVGWFHSHPNHGIFLSPDDLNIHHNYFKQEWQTALVFDPLRKDGGFFVWQPGNNIVRAPGFYEILQSSQDRSTARQWHYGNQQKSAHMTPENVVKHWGAEFNSLTGLMALILLAVVLILSLWNVQRIARLEAEVNNLATDANTNQLSAQPIATQPQDTTPLPVFRNARLQAEQGGQEIELENDGQYRVNLNETYQACVTVDYGGNPRPDEGHTLIFRQVTGEMKAPSQSDDNPGSVTPVEGGEACFSFTTQADVTQVRIDLCCSLASQKPFPTHHQIFHLKFPEQPAS